MNKKSIVVVTSGWVFLGVYHAATETAPARITDAATVRVWGTTSGLGQLALAGPTASTTLDPCGEVVLPNPQAVLFVHPCNW